MKRYFAFVYWGAATVLTSLMLMSVAGSFSMSFFLATLLLPGILLIKYLLRDINFTYRGKAVFKTVYALTIFILTEYLAILCFLSFTGMAPSVGYDGILMNPAFLCFILVSLLSIEELIKIKILPEVPAAKFVTFTSERKKISIETESITFIESKDYEVSVMTVSGRAYPTRMKISQWESALDDRFIRVHRSFIVNREHISTFDSKAVYLDGMRIEISRKYKDDVANKLGSRSS